MLKTFTVRTQNPRCTAVDDEHIYPTQFDFLIKISRVLLSCVRFISILRLITHSVCS